MFECTASKTVFYAECAQAILVQKINQSIRCSFKISVDQNAHTQKTINNRIE